MRRRSLRAALPLLLALAGCFRAPPTPPTPQQIPLPSPDEVERVVFLVGDPGEAHADSYPILSRLQQDIEGWATTLADSAVTVLYLGDLVYPLGMHPPGHEAFPGDSAIIADQARMVAGPSARAKRAHALFMAGNHDWGLEEDWEGYVRIRTLGDFLRREQARTGAAVSLVPEAGLGGPTVLDLGRHLRVLVLDTAWWLLFRGASAQEARLGVLRGIEEAMRTAGDREILIAAHHPFRTAGPHGGSGNAWEALGLRYLLTRSGAILQDITSVPYRELEGGLREIFRRNGPPLVFAGGHEHSLQVFSAVAADDPKFSLVSGSASKVSVVGTGPGLQFARSAPGYMRLLVEKDGGMVLTVEAVDPRFKSCGGTDGERSACMAEGIAGYRTVHSQRLR